MCFEAEFVEAAECGQVRREEGSVVHVGVFRMGSVGTSILGRPRCLLRECHAGRLLSVELPPHLRRANILHTFNLLRDVLPAAWNIVNYLPLRRQSLVHTVVKFSGEDPWRIYAPPRMYGIPNVTSPHRKS